MAFFTSDMEGRESGAFRSPFGPVFCSKFGRFASKSIAFASESATFGWLLSSGTLQRGVAVACQHIGMLIALQEMIKLGQPGSKLDVPLPFQRTTHQNSNPIHRKNHENTPKLIEKHRKATEYPRRSPENPPQQCEV